MPRSFPHALKASRAVLRILIVLNPVFGAFVLALLVATLLAETPIMSALGVRPGPGSGGLILGLRVLTLIGLCSVPLAHIVLTRLLAIVGTVQEGDPFVADNAARLQTIAWALLGLELLHLLAGAVSLAASSEGRPLEIDWNFSITSWLAVLLLFVLARVFDHGARMREELEGTV